MMDGFCLCRGAGASLAAKPRVLGRPRPCVHQNETGRPATKSVSMADPLRLWKRPGMEMEFR
jgi:hypothetical protein